MYLKCGAVLLVLSFSAPAVAQTTPAVADLELEDLMKVTVQSVFGASKFLQKVTDAPAAVSVVTALDIERYGCRTLAEVIRSAPGFNVTYDRNYTYVGVRGFQRPGDYNSRVLVLVDGHRINEPIYDMAYVGTEFPVDVELVDRVELIRGPSSSIYGTNAFFAVINVVTKRGEALKGVLLAGDGGSLQTGRAPRGVRHHARQQSGPVAFGIAVPQRGREAPVLLGVRRSDDPWPTSTPATFVA